MAGPWRPEPGSTLDGRVAIEREIGAGPTGVVYAARDLRADTPVAIKVFHPALFQGAVHGPNLLRLQRARAYVHDDVVRLHDVVVGDRVYALTDLVEAPSLEALVADRGPVARDEIPGLLEGVVDALGWIHQIAVHGNLKPSNVFVPERGGALVGDPWCLDGTVAVPPGELPERSMRWLAPEQRAGAWKERPETDVFGLARLVAWLLAGGPVEEGRGLSQQGVAVPESVEVLILSAMAPIPDDRPGTVGEFWRSLVAAWGAADWSEADARAAAAAVALEDEEEPPIGSQTEAIPLDELRAMGLDPGLGDAEEVEAIVFTPEEGAEGASPLDETSVDEILEIDAADVVEVSEAELEAAPADEPLEVETADVVEVVEEPEGADSPPADEKPVAAPVVYAPTGPDAPLVRFGPNISEEAARSAGDVPGPGATRSAGPATRPPAEPGTGRAVEPRRAASGQGPPTKAPKKRRPATTRRSPLIVIAPLLFVLAAAMVFYVLDTVQERRYLTAEETGTTRAEAESEAAAVRGAAEPGSLPAAVEPALAASPEPDAGARGADASGRATGSALAAAAPGLPGEDVAADEPAGEETAAAGSEASAETNREEPSEAKAEDPAEAKREEPAEAKQDEPPEPPKPAEPAVVGPTPDELECPGGMAEIRRKREIELDDGAPGVTWDVWCIDRYEYPGKGAIPKVEVTRDQARSLCRSEGKRLCKRMEWRRACGWNYPYRGDYDPNACNTIGSDFMPRPLVPSGTKSSCRNGWGLYDMVGNVAEWTSDGRVNGGSAKKDGASAKCQRSARRKGGSPYVGFRCCADPDRS